MSSTLLWLTVALAMGLAAQNRLVAQNTDPTDADRRATAFIAEHEAKVRPLDIAVSRAWWKANTTGDDADFAVKEQAQNKLDQALSDSHRFAELKALKDAKLSDGLVARQIAV